MSDPKPQELHYAAPSPWHRRRSARRVLLLCFALIALGTCLHFARTVIDHVEANYYFQRCMNYEPAKGQLACTISPAGNVFFTPPPWTNFSMLWSGSAPMSDGTIFLHERKTPAGAARLVVVDIIGANPADNRLQLQAHVFAPPIGLAPAQRKSAIIHPIQLDDCSQLRIPQAQPDAEDSSHFTITCENPRQQTIIDGWLRDDDKVLLEPRENLSTQPSAKP